MEEKRLSVDDVLKDYKAKSDKKPEIVIPENAPIETPEIVSPKTAEVEIPSVPQPAPEVSNEEKPANEQVHTAPAVNSIEIENGYSPEGKAFHYIDEEVFEKALKEQSEIYENTIDIPVEDCVFGANAIPEYKSAKDKQAVSSALHNLQKQVSLSLSVTAICALISVVFTFIPKLWANMNMPVYIIINIALILISALINYKNIAFGLKGLFTLTANHHSAVSFAYIIVLLQCVTAFFAPDGYKTGLLHLYTPLVLVAQLCNIIGMTSQLRRISKNFIFLSSPDKKYNIDLVESNNDSVKIAGEYIERQPLVAFQNSADFYTRFIANSFKSDPSRLISQMIAPVGVIASLILFIASFIMYKNFVSAFAAFAASSCIFVPFAAIICVNFPVSALSSLARKWGAMITGYPTAEKFARTNIVMIDALELFPKGSVEIKSVKTFENADAKTALIYAASLVSHFGGPLSEIFGQVLQTSENTGVNLENPVYEEGLGLSAWADGAKILVGNRKLMTKYAVALPGKDIETKFSQSGNQLLYIASSGVLTAMLVLSYRGDSRRAAELSRLDRSGYLITIRTNDVNITPALVSSRFKIDSRAVRILPTKLNYLYKENVEASAKTADALFLSKGRITTMFRLLSACAVQKSNISFAIILQAIAVVLGFLFVAFIVCYSGLEQLRSSAVLLYELFWILAIIIVPKLRRP